MGQWCVHRVNTRNRGNCVSPNNRIAQVRIAADGGANALYKAAGEHGDSSFVKLSAIHTSMTHRFIFR